MFRKMNKKWFRQATLFFIFVMSALCYSSIITGENEGGDSPQTVFKAAQQAGAKKDFATLTKLVAPGQRYMMAFSSDIGVGMFVEFYEGPKAEELKKKYQEIQDKYEINSETQGETLQITPDTPQDVIDAHVDTRAKKKYGHADFVNYIPELMALVLEMPELAEQTFIPQEELSDLKVDGDHATGKAGEKDIAFIREGGRWYLTSDVMD